MIRILRLKNGEDIIGTILNDENTTYDIGDPMTVDIEVRGNNGGHLVMGHWLPVQLIKHNIASIKFEDVLTSLEPQDHFVEYYSNTVEKLQKIIKAKEEAENMSDEEITEILSTLENMDEDRVLH
jgi:hypothetical protein